MPITMEKLHQDMKQLKKEVHEIKELLLREPELREEIVKKLEQARKEIKTDFVTHEEMMEEFAGE